MGNSSAKPAAFEPIRRHLTTGNRRAAILGATGATGQYVVHHLLASDEWSKVTVIHRRKLDMEALEKETGKLTDEQKSKLTQHEVDMSKLTEQEALFQGHDVVFCTLGTTRSAAKSADAFRKVDLEMVRDGAIAAKKAGVPQYSLLTSQGASAGMWANDWKLMHGLLYLQVKGLAEQEVTKLKFPRTSIFRPGMLERPGSDRFFEKIGLLSSTHVSVVARAMVLDAESDQPSGDEPEKPLIYESQAVQQLGQWKSGSKEKADEKKQSEEPDTQGVIEEEKPQQS